MDQAMEFINPPPATTAYPPPIFSSHALMQPNDLVLLYVSKDSMTLVRLDPTKEYNNRFGCFPHASLLNKPFGSRIPSRSTTTHRGQLRPRGYIHALRPTAELWTRALPHRTQILYGPDIAFIIASLGLRQGSRVIEAGTGSGSFTHAIARTIDPFPSYPSQPPSLPSPLNPSLPPFSGPLPGHLWTFEYHAERYEKAKIELEQHGIVPHRATITHRNVAKLGFSPAQDVDAIFLDLPSPHLVIPHAKQALRKDRIAKICCFSPCIEQVQRTVLALNAHGFSDIRMFECHARPRTVHVTQPPTTIGARIARLRALREKQIAMKQAQDDGTELKRQLDTLESDPTPDHKRICLDAADQDDTEEIHSEQSVQVPTATVMKPVPISEVPPGLIQSKPAYDQRGHTSWLLFANLLPSP